MTFELPHTKPVFKHQPDATINVTDPVSGQKYEWKDPDENPLGTQKNVRILSIAVSCTWTVQPTPLEVWVTIDGETKRHYFGDPVSATNYYAFLTPGSPATNEGLTETIGYAVYKAFLIEGRSIKVEAEITGGTVSNLTARVKWAKME